MRRDDVERVCLVAVRKASILAVRARNRSRFYCPGGQIATGETEEVALHRELTEEIGFDCCRGRLTYWRCVTAFADGRPSGSKVRMICFTTDEPVIARACGEVAEVRRVDWWNRDCLGEASRIVFGLSLGIEE